MRFLTCIAVIALVASTNIDARCRTSGCSSGGCGSNKSGTCSSSNGRRATNSQSLGQRTAPLTVTRLPAGTRGQANVTPIAATQTVTETAPCAGGT